MTTLRKLPMIAPRAKANAGTMSSIVCGTTERSMAIRIGQAAQAAGASRRPTLDRSAGGPYHATSMVRPRARSSILAAILAAVGILMAFRYQGPLQERLLVRRLAQDLPPDESVKTARALRALDPVALALLAPEAK